MPKISLAAARTNVNLTQEEAAKKLNIARSTLANYEKGITFPKQPMIEKICELYKLSFDSLDFKVN